MRDPDCSVDVVSRTMARDRIIVVAAIACVARRMKKTVRFGAKLMAKVTIVNNNNDPSITGRRPK